MINERFTIATPAFAGPLETLLNMIEERKMSISDISLSEVTDAYLAYVEKLPELPLGETAQFILVASTLLLIKSRALLPTLELSEDERESVEELERRLERLRLIRKIAKTLRKEWGRAPFLLARRAPKRAVTFSPADATISTLVRAAKGLLSILPKPEEMARVAVAPVLALEDVIAHLKKRLSTTFKARFSELTRSRDRHEVIVYFLGILELVRTGSASVSQERLFDDITIEIENITGAPKFGV
ncbi:MAG: segregation/condensation protein A [bacterium]|nr:segregation/condensation protein A [bacterium]